jgi:dimeric dUTPase (all-alpha-NTP-PPase superfamily)
MEDRFGLMLKMQLELQQQHMKDGDPRFLEGDHMAEFMRWNAWAVEDELHEAMAEVGWKPWATSRHINQEAFMKEMVDAFHFFMNMLLCGCQGWSPSQIADEFTKMYIVKNAINAQRQAKGYNGVTGKCPKCHRELEVGCDCEVEDVYA